MAESQYVGWWSLGEVHERDQPIIEDMETDRTENDSGIFVWFENQDEAEAAADEGIIVVEVDGGFDREDMNREVLHVQAGANGIL